MLRERLVKISQFHQNILHLRHYADWKNCRKTDPLMKNNEGLNNLRNDGEIVCM